jgi:hypothetical protein
MTGRLAKPVRIEEGREKHELAHRLVEARRSGRSGATDERSR